MVEQDKGDGAGWRRTAASNASGRYTPCPLFPHGPDMHPPPHNSKPISTQKKATKGPVRTKMTAKMTARLATTSPSPRHRGRRHHTRGAHGGGVPCIASRRQRGEQQGHPEGSRATDTVVAGLNVKSARKSLWIFDENGQNGVCHACKYPDEPKAYHTIDELVA